MMSTLDKRYAALVWLSNNNKVVQGVGVLLEGGREIEDIINRVMDFLEVVILNKKAIDITRDDVRDFITVFSRNRK